METLEKHKKQRKTKARKAKANIKKWKILKIIRKD